MKTKSLFAGSALVVILALAAALSGCATRPAGVEAQLHPSQHLENPKACCEWARALDESQAAAAASWRL